MSAEPIDDSARSEGTKRADRGKAHTPKQSGNSHSFSHDNRDKGDPIAETSERAILGAVLEDPSLITSELASVSVSDFSITGHRRLYSLYLELVDEGKPFDELIIRDLLQERNQLDEIGGFSYLIDIQQGVLTVPSHVRWHAERVINAKRLRNMNRVAEAIQEKVLQPAADHAMVLNWATDIMGSLAMGYDLDGNLTPVKPHSLKKPVYKRFEDIPDIFTLEIPLPEYFVDGLIARETITEWTGLGGAGKSFLLEKLGIDVATGGTFLGMQCKPANVLYLDYENPGFVVKARLRKMSGDNPVDRLRIWGKWCQSPAPSIGHDVLNKIVAESQPLLLIIDPLRDAHSGDENDSGEMKAVMDCLRSYTTMGTAVITAHHVARYDGSMSRGSTAIYDAMDVALLQQKDKQTGIISLEISKHRWAETRTIGVRIDFAGGNCEVTDNPKVAREAEEVTKLYSIIVSNPGLTQTEVWKASGMGRTRVFDLLKEHQGSQGLWQMKQTGQAFRYYPHSYREETTGTQ